ncbi:MULTISPECIES: hypothetical protein [Dehalobacter]|uniref:Carbohydrate-binding domain-containing protein n=1 Tax=Dehalobacter restrictus (strain DSM 9455 / PER-K23) TaxID=871738 RepID=A0ABN4C0R1_DEHRP|nr:MULTISPECIES: hypothetical protein [Dehalobacter]AHF11425.1 hypothetical protein DEHRE_10680 [Dehalobacter restrictus DSM 9455]MDJ0304877.1 hypothetical protein [Dehalobacter sp.]
MKKTILILVLVCLMTILFTGCGKASNTENPAATENPASTETENPQKAEGTVEKVVTSETNKTQEPVSGDSKATKPIETVTPQKAVTPKATTPKAATPKATTPEPTKSPEPVSQDSGEIIVSSFAELQTAVADTKITVINVGSDMEITSKLEYEREDDLAIYIKKGTTLTISDEFIPVGGSITNDGAIIVKGTFNRGICSFINNGSVTVRSSGTASSGMCSADNNGNYIVDNGGQLLIERGSEFKNLGTLTNNGFISVKDGGSLYNETGSLINNGTIDLYAYFGGDIAKITGTGTLNDHR